MNQHNLSSSGLPAAILAASLWCWGCSPATPTKPTLDQVIRMSQESVPADRIVGTLRDSRAVYPVTASDLLRLHDQGVSDMVLDYIQNAYVARVKEDARLRSLMTGKGPGVNK
jgi:hypothetical protein